MSFLEVQQCAQVPVADKPAILTLALGAEECLSLPKGCFLLLAEMLLTGAVPVAVTVPRPPAVC